MNTFLYKNTFTLFNSDNKNNLNYDKLKENVENKLKCILF